MNQKTAEAEPGYLRVLERNGRTEKDWKVPASSKAARTSLRRTALANWMTDTTAGGGASRCPGDGQPSLAASPGPGNRRHTQRFRRTGRAAFAPRAARVAGFDFVQHGWGLKRLHRMIVTSAVYMEDSRFDETRAKVDRENVLALAIHAAAARGRADPRHVAGGFGPARLVRCSARARSTRTCGGEASISSSSEASSFPR